jgi:hypothetical protein
MSNRLSSAMLNFRLTRVKEINSAQNVLMRNNCNMPPLDQATFNPNLVTNLLSRNHRMLVQAASCTSALRQTRHAAAFSVKFKEG